MAWDDTPPTVEELRATSASWDSTPPTEEELKSTGDFEGLNPLVPLGPQGGTISEKIKQAAKETFLPPTNAEEAERLLNPSAGRYGINRLLEDAGQTVASSARTAGKNLAEKFVQLPGVNKFPNAAAAVGSGSEALVDLLSGTLTPSGAQQQIGAMGPDIAAPILKASPLVQVPARMLERTSQNMALKEMGASPMQVRQIGAEDARALGQKGMDEGIVRVLSTDEGTEGRISGLLENSGDAIGKFRKAAGERGAGYSPESIVAEIKKRLDPEYESGVKSGETGSYMKALEEIAKSDGTPDGISKAITRINKYASANKLHQASGAMSDVANIASEINNSAIKSVLSPEESAVYEKSLRDYGAARKIEQFHARKEAREAAGRIGPGGGVRHLMQSALDSFGYKSGAKVMNWLSKILKENPSMAKELPEAFKNYPNMPEPPDFEGLGLSDGGVVQMAHGGRVESSPATDDPVHTHRPDSWDSQNLTDALQRHPEVFGKYAPYLMDAARRGPQSLAATHFVLQQNDPEYNRLMNTHHNNAD
jgi:hypothetical protein